MPANHSASGSKRHAAWRPDAVVVLALLAVLAAAVAAWAFTQTATVAATTGVPYTQSGSLAYSAAVDPASVYGTSQAVTGEPLYAASVHGLTLTYAYRFKAATTRGVGGTEQLVATINNGEGLVRTIDLQPVTPFSGDGFTATATADLSSFTAVANAFSAAGGTQGNGSYTVAISPSVVVHGQVGGAHINAAFGTAVHLTLNANGLFPPSSAASSTPGVPSSTHPFSVTSSGSVTVPVQQSRTLFLHLSVSTARTLAVAVFLACLLLCVLIGLSLLRDTKNRDEDVRIAARHASKLVDVTALPSSVEVVTVPLRTMDDLVEVGRRLEVPILHEGGANATYAVIDNGVLYTYRTGPARLRGRGDIEAAGSGARIHQTG